MIQLNSQERWDRYFINIANIVRTKSKDNSSQIGAVIVGPDNQIVSTGFNGFPRGIDETDVTRWERPIKYAFVEHAERNAIYNAARHGISLRGCTMYMVGFLPAVPCTECAKGIIQAGITRFVGCGIKEASGVWIDDLRFARKLLLEADVVLKEIKRE